MHREEVPTAAARPIRLRAPAKGRVAREMAPVPDKEPDKALAQAENPPHRTARRRQRQTSNLREPIAAAPPIRLRAPAKGRGARETAPVLDKELDKALAQVERGPRGSLRKTRTTLTAPSAGKKNPTRVTQRGKRISRRIKVSAQKPTATATNSHPLTKSPPTIKIVTAPTALLTNRTNPATNR